MAWREWLSIRQIPRDPLRDGYVLAAVAWCVAIAAGLAPLPNDAAQYWLHRLPNPYDAVTYGLEGFWYPPIAAQLVYPFTLLPLTVFCALVVGAGFLALYAILGRWAWAGLLFPPVWWDLSGGNISTILGACAIYSARYPTLALIPAFTKVTPGIVGLWHVARGDWAAVRRLVLYGGVLTAISFALAPDLWFAWAKTILRIQGYMGPGYFVVAIPLLPRLLVAVPLLVWGARTNRTWVLPVAAWLALSVPWWSTAAMLMAVAKRYQSPGNLR